MSNEDEQFSFQSFSWFVDDGTTEVDDFDNMDFTVHIFGKTRNGESVAVHVKGYHPSFCIKYDPRVSTIADYEQLFEMFGNKLAKWEENMGKWTKTHDYPDHLIEISDRILTKKTLWGFDRRTYPFFKFCFRSLHAYNKILRICRDCHKNTMSDDQMEQFFEEYQSIIKEDGKPDYESQREFLTDYADSNNVSSSLLTWIVKLGKTDMSFEFAKGKLFEVIDPILRFVHLRHLKTAGWIRLSNFKKLKDFEKTTTCAIELTAMYEDLHPVITDDICPTIREMAFDIEAYSYNDLFPDPRVPKNYAYQIGVTVKDYAEKGFDRIILHCRTPKELRGDNSGFCAEIDDIPSCLRSYKPLQDCENKECSTTGHLRYDVKTIVKNFETEKELLIYFAEMIIKEDPDLIYGYNSDVFDWDYLMTRAQIVGLEVFDKFCKISRFKDYHCKVEEKKFTSSAYGDNRYRRVDIPGRLNIDLMIWIQRNMPQDRYPSHSLDTVAGKEIDEQKRDVDTKDIFQAFRSGDPKELTKIGDYCCQDTVLVQKLVNKLDVVTQMFEMANITDTPPMYLLQKGQQIKCYSQISKMALEKGFLVPLAEDREDGKFKGAIVLEPKVGMYHTPVAVLDFASLYPSIQVAYQVCYTTIVLDQAVHAKLVEMKNRNEPLMIDDVKYDLIEWEEELYVYENRETGFKKEFTSIDDAKSIQPKKAILESIEKGDETAEERWYMKTKYYSYAFAQNQPSVIPELQVHMKTFRKRVKVMMAQIEHSKDPDDQLRYRVLNGRQLAIKVSMNSLYGFTSAFMLNLMALSAAVTAKGRQMIEQTKEFMEKRFEQIGRNSKWTKEDELTFFAPDGKQILAKETDGKWIFEFRGTELCKSDAGVIPKDWIKKYPVAVDGEPWISRSLSINVVGGDSVTGDTPILCKTKTGQYLYRTIDNIGIGPWERRIDGKEYQMCDLEVWSDAGFTPVRHIIRHYTDKKMFRVSTHTGIVNVTEDHSLLDENAVKVKPKDVIIGQRLLHKDLPNVTIENEMSKAMLMQGNFTKIQAAVVYFNIIKDSPLKIYEEENGDIRFYSENVDKNILNDIKNIKELPKTTQFVYDIETANHHFAVGPGRLIVSNTDSVFCNFPVSDINETISLCHKASDLLTETVFNRKPIEMEYEKTYVPIVIQKKKNYIGLKYEMDNYRWKLDYKGIAVKRRDSCDFTKEVFWAVIHPSLGLEEYVVDEKKKLRKAEWDYRLGPDKAIECLEQKLKKMETDEIPMDDLLIFKSMKSDYKGPLCTGCGGEKTFKCPDYKGRANARDPRNTIECSRCNRTGEVDCKVCGGRGKIVNLPHIQLAKRMKERDAGSAPVSGQHFAYVVIHDDDRPNELSQRTEDPKFAKSTGLKPDYLWYLDFQVRKPVTKFLTIVGRQSETEKTFEKSQKILFSMLQKDRKKKEQEKMKTFFTAGAKRAAPIAPLKPPKKQNTGKKKSESTAGYNKISSFFTPK